MNYLDIAIVIFMLYIVIMGYIHGFVRSLFNLLGYVVAAIATHYYYQVVKKMLVDLTTLDDKLTEFVKNRLQEMGAQSAQSTVTVSDLNAMNQLPLPAEIKEEIQSFLTNTATSVSSNIATVVSDLVMSFIAIVGLFVIILLVVKIVAAIFDVISKLPVLNTFNKAGGVLFGLLKGYIILSLIFVIAISFLSLGAHPQVESLLDTSVIAPVFINYNILLMWFSQFS